ncbi:hypothetical protein CZ794_02260 [Psychrobacter sp. JB385]|nr:hypothetical protein CZ794_02260 [Psychrobacter sp. JB385]
MRIKLKIYSQLHELVWRQKPLFMTSKIQKTHFNSKIFTSLDLALFRII